MTYDHYMKVCADIFIFGLFGGMLLLVILVWFFPTSEGDNF